jgi:radical SAM superfamily enzyme YgiQ (UPF0313 family)
MDTLRPFGVKLIHCGNINPVNPEDREQKNIFYMPMGLLALASVLREAACDVEIIHSDLVPGPEIIGAASDGVNAVGLDCHWINQARAVLDTAAAIKKINPDIFVFLGGYSASLFAEEIAAGFPQVDAVVRGDGEIPIVRLITALREQKPLDIVPNLVWQDKQGKVRSNAFTYSGSPGEMNRLDFASFELLRNAGSYKELSRFWTRFSPFEDSPLFLLEVGRGCQYACTFCGGNCEAQHRISNRKQTVVRSVDSIIDTIKKAVAYGFETFYTCLEFEGSDEWYTGLFQRIKEEGLDINFVYGSWKLPTNKLLDVLCHNFKNAAAEISPETGSIQLRKKNKDNRLFYSNHQLEQCLQYCETKENLKIQLYFGYYLVGDTEKTIMETLRYILELTLAYPDLLEIEYSNFSTDPGSLLFFHPERYNIDMGVRTFKDYLEHIDEHYIIKKGQQADMTVFKPGGISTRQDMEIHRRLKLFNRLFSFFRKSVSYRLQKTGEPGIIMEISHGSGEADPCPCKENECSPDHLKKLLFDSCIRNDILNSYMVKTLGAECEAVKTGQQVVKAAPQLWLYRDREEASREEEESEGMEEYLAYAEMDNSIDRDLTINLDLDFDEGE